MGSLETNAGCAADILSTKPSHMANVILEPRVRRREAANERSYLIFSRFFDSRERVAR